MAVTAIEIGVPSQTASGVLGCAVIAVNGLIAICTDPDPVRSLLHIVVGFATLPKV